MKKSDSTSEIEALKAALKREQEKNECLKKQNKALKAKVSRAAAKQAKTDEVVESVGRHKLAEEELKKKGLWTDRVGDVLSLLFPDTDTQN